jgi:hypothetical protein
MIALSPVIGIIAGYGTDNDREFLNIISSIGETNRWCKRQALQTDRAPVTKAIEVVKNLLEKSTHFSID